MGKPVESFTPELAAKIAERHEPNGSDRGGIGDMLPAIQANVAGDAPTGGRYG